MKSILLHIHDDDCLEARLQVALDLARTFGGHLTCLQATPYELGVPGDLYGAAAAQLLPAIREQADAVRDRFERRLTSEDVVWDWLQEDGLAHERLLRRSGLSDVVVLGSCEPLRTKGPSTLVGDVVLRSQTPTLVVPPEARSIDWTGPAMVAWDGSPEASRALRGALPLLAKSSSVTLVTIDGESEKDIDLPPTEGAEFLARHSIECEMADLPLRGASVAEAIVREAALREASYLVMGAYGHARLLERIWGGVTRELLTRPPLPILACH
jgi:nucleotide-binding universal stress UspA family protein